MQQPGQITLGSTSPRRKEILGYFSLPFIQRAPPFDERSVRFEADPKAYVTQIAQGKALSLARDFAEEIIVAADTNVFCEGKIYGKPKSESEARQALEELTDRWHTVYTAVTVQRGEKSVTEVEATRVLFNALTSKQIYHYVQHVSWADKAAGYAIQLAAGLIVKKIEGCYYNVMGLPINTLRRGLLSFDIELWNYL